MRIVPAYRVVAKLAREARPLPREEAANAIEAGVRRYVRSMLAMLNPAIAELGERTAAAQLGDPDPQSLGAAIERIEAAAPRDLAAETLARCAAEMPRPDMDARVFLLPGDGDSRVLTRQMNGVTGFSLGSHAIVVFLWPVAGWEKWLRYTLSHEYAHLVRNHLFPRTMTAGKLVFAKTQQPETLLDAMVMEGIADAFAMSLNPDVRPAWVDALSPESEAAAWPRVHRRLAISDTAEIRRVVFGDNDRVPVWTGYTMGFRIVTRYLEANPGARPAALIGLPASTVYEQSGYQRT